VLKLRAQIASFRFAHGSQILIVMIGMNRAQRLAEGLLHDMQIVP
jgi:hypothetical protein